MSDADASVSDSTDPLVEALCDAEYAASSALECSSDEDEWKRTGDALAAAKARLSAVLAAVRDLADLHRAGKPARAEASLLIQTLSDAIAAADGAR